MLKNSEQKMSAAHPGLSAKAYQKSEILLKQTGKPYHIGFWINGTNSWVSTNVKHSEDCNFLGMYDMNGDGKKDLVVIGSDGIGATKITHIGFYRECVDKASAWTTIGTLATPESAQWQVVIGNLTGKKGFNSVIWYSAPLKSLGAWLDGSKKWVSINGGWDKDWVLLGCGDFDGSGQESVLMYYRKDSRYYSVNLQGKMTDLGVLDTAWRLCAVGDLDGNGKDDLIFIHDQLQTLMKWRDGLAKQWQSLGQIDVTHWRIIGCGRYAGNAAMDLLLQNISSGSVGYFEGGDQKKWRSIGTPGAGWTVLL